MLILVNPDISAIAKQIGATYTAATRNREGVAANAAGVLGQQPLFELPEGIPHVARDGKLVPYTASKEDDMSLALSGEPVSIFVRTLICSPEVADAINEALAKRLGAQGGDAAATEIPLAWRAAIARRLARSFKPDEAISESSLKGKVDTALALVSDDVSWQMLLELEATLLENATLKAQADEARRLHEAAGQLPGASDAVPRRTAKTRTPRGAAGDSPTGDGTGGDGKPEGHGGPNDGDGGAAAEGGAGAHAPATEPVVPPSADHGGDAGQRRDSESV